MLTEYELNALDKLNDQPSVVCGACGGKGKVWYWVNGGYGIRRDKLCSECHGKGRFEVAR